MGMHIIGVTIGRTCGYAHHRCHNREDMWRMHIIGVTIGGHVGMHIIGVTIGRTICGYAHHRCHNREDMWVCTS